MPKTQRNREKAEVAKDWVSFKFSRYLWVRFLQKCVDSGKDVDETIAQFISGWCWVLSQQRTEAPVHDKDDLEKEFALLCEDLNRRTLPHVTREELTALAIQIRKHLRALNKIERDY
jgi:hypothetical protein